MVEDKLVENPIDARGLLSRIKWSEWLEVT